MIVDDDPFVLGLLTHVGEARGWPIVAVRSAEAAESAMAERAFGVAVIDLRLGASSGLELVRRLRERDLDVEAIVISADRRLSVALESFDQEVFAFLPKPLDPAHVFATVERAAAHRRDVIERRRLTWELGLLNEIAEIVASSFDVEAVLPRALERVRAAFHCAWVFVRVTPTSGGPPVALAGAGITPAAIDEIYRTSTRQLPSDVVFHTGRPMRIDVGRRDDYASAAPVDMPWTASISVPMATADQVLGVITLVSTERAAFSDDDERVITTIGRQFGVAVANAQLYQRVHRAKVEWERTFDAISDPIAVFGADRKTMRMNAALAAMHQWPITETQGRSCADVGLCGGDRPDCLVARALADGQRHTGEVTTADRRAFAVTALPVPGAAAVVLFAKEVTEEREHARQLRSLSSDLTSANAALTDTVSRLQTTQAQLVQSEKLSAIGQLVAGVAHELNNPLTSVIGYAQLVQEALAQPPDQWPPAAAMSADVTRVISEADRAARIVRNLLTFARRQTSSRVPTDLGELCQRVLGLRTYDHQVRQLNVELAVDGPLPAVYADDSQIQQAVLNLVLNAEQALRGVERPSLTLSVSPEPVAGAVLVTVTDNGHGIDAEDLPRVFDPFFTTRDVGEGTGLGLSIVYGIVRDHGGQIWVESVAGRTTFFIRLPARLAQPAGATPPAAVVAHADRGSRDYLIAALAGWGYSVRAAATIDEALAQVATHDADLLFLDPSLVERDVARWRAAWSAAADGLRLIAIDAPTVSPEAAQFLRESATFVLIPPFALPYLRAATLAASRPPI